VIDQLFSRWQLRKLAFVGFAFVGAFAQARAGERLTVDLPSMAQVSQPEVLLSDVARLSGATLPVQIALNNVFLGRMPTNGQPMTLQREALSRWVRQQTGLKDSQLEWTGASAIEVSWLKSTLSGSNLTQVATDGLRRWLLERSERVELQAVTDTADLAVPGNDVQLRMRRINQTVPRERMVVWVDVFSGERFFKAVPITFKVVAWGSTSVATQSVSAGEPLRSDEVRTVKANLAALPLREAAVAGQPLVLDHTVRLKRSVREGEVVTPSHFEASPAVARGDWAVLQTGSGAVMLESRVQVPHDAKLGQSMRVKPAQSSSYVWARVKGPNLLELVQ
jgi:flagellar basal body P-ring formation protein FlgA